MNFVTPLVIHERPTFDEYLAKYPSTKVATYAYNNAMKVWVRTRLSESQNHKCCWCGRMTTELPDRKHSATIEHIVPRSCGGTDDYDNLAMACKSCNSNRGTVDPDEYMRNRTVKPTIMPKMRKVRVSDRRAEVFAALEQSKVVNPFEVGSKNWKTFEYYSAKWQENLVG